MKAAYVYKIEEIPHTDDCLLGVVISIDRKWNKQRHCGIVFNLHNELRILHLATHNKVQCDRNFGDFLCWIKPDIHPSLQEAFCAYLEIVGEAVDRGNNEIPYGFLYDDYARIEPDGTLILGGKKCGLTCATYVLTLFASKGFRLIDLDSWTSREEDKSWFYQIIKIFYVHFLNKQKMSLAHFKRLLSEIGCPRYRPEEIAVSSALYTNQAASTEAIRSEGRGLLDYLLEIT